MTCSITQGTVITSLRSKKYCDNRCYGVIITAKCDLANNKVDKVFYLEALKIEDWLLSQKGFETAISGIIKDKENNLKATLKDYNIDWATIKGFSESDTEKVIDCVITKDKTNKNVKRLLKEFNDVNKSSSSLNVRKNFIRENKKSISDYLKRIVNGQNTHYVYLPEETLKGNIKNGVIVDLQEVDFLDIDTVTDLSKFLIDCKNEYVSDEKKELYNQKFFIYDDPGYSVILCQIESPWIEYLMQHFSNSFIRIGVDNPSSKTIKKIIDCLVNEGE